jgi:Leucine-rich repeat (LRR) protein
MKPALITVVIYLFAVHLYAQDKSFRPTYIYEGYIQTALSKKLPIKLNFLVLLDSTIVGSYWYKPEQGNLQLTGKMYKDNTFILYERDAKEQVTGTFKGKFTVNSTKATGLWTSTKNDKSFRFSLSLTNGMKSYWDYIRKFRSLPEYHNIDSAIRRSGDVVSVDVASQEISYLPKQFNKLHHVLSVNLLGNRFKTFPDVLTNLVQLQEISLSSNELAQVTSKVGRLRNLRILIMNNNKLKELPKEIGMLEDLLYLELGNNKLTTLPFTISNLKHLQELHIERNPLNDIERAKIKKLLPKCVIHF